MHDDILTTIVACMEMRYAHFRRIVEQSRHTMGQFSQSHLRQFPENQLQEVIKELASYPSHFL